MKSKKRSVFFVIITIIVVLVCCGIIIYNNSDSVRLNRQLELGQKYLTELDYEQAIVAYEAAIQIEPMSVEAYLGMAEAYLCMNKYEDAINTLQKGYEKTEKNNEIKSKLINVCEELASNAYEQNDYVTTLYYLDKIISLEGMENKMYDILEDVLQSYIEVLLAEERYDEIKTLIEKYKDLNLDINFEEILSVVENEILNAELLKAFDTIAANHTMDGKRLIEWTKEETKELMLSLGGEFDPDYFEEGCVRGDQVFWSGKTNKTSLWYADLIDTDIRILWGLNTENNYDEFTVYNYQIRIMGKGALPLENNNKDCINLGISDRVNSYLGRTIAEVLNEISPGLSEKIPMTPDESGHIQLATGWEISSYNANLEYQLRLAHNHIDGNNYVIGNLSSQCYFDVCFSYNEEGIIHDISLRICDVI